MSIQHLPQSSAFSPTVLRHKKLLTVTLTMPCEIRGRSGRLVSMIMLLAMPECVFPPFLLHVFVVNGSKLLKEMIPKATFNSLFLLFPQPPAVSVK